MNRLRVLLIGAGGLGGEIAHGLVRKGVFHLKIFDGDFVSLTNLTRQYFYEFDLMKNKAICLGKNLIKEATRQTEITAYPMMFQKAVEEKTSMDCDVVVCAPDNDDTRIYVSKYFMNKVPVIFTGLDLEASTGYIFIQNQGQACIACARPNAIIKERFPCGEAAAIIDLGKIVSGFALFAIDTTVMKRKTGWNYRQFFIAGFAPDIVQLIEKKKDCPLCKRARKRNE
jgi:molybdopterin/thiamine biosynthesis adenylyltransferase